MMEKPVNNCVGNKRILIHYPKYCFGIAMRAISLQPDMYSTVATTAIAIHAGSPNSVVLHFRFCWIVPFSAVLSSQFAQYLLIADLTHCNTLKVFAGGLSYSHPLSRKGSNEISEIALVLFYCGSLIYYKSSTRLGAVNSFVHQNHPRCREQYCRN